MLLALSVAYGHAGTFLGFPLVPGDTAVQVFYVISGFYMDNGHVGTARLLPDGSIDGTYGTAGVTNFTNFAWYTQQVLATVFGPDNRLYLTGGTGDTQLDASKAVTVGQTMISDPDIYGVVGPSGSQEVDATGKMFADANGSPFIRSIFL